MDLKAIDTTKPVMVTGATGFVAGWIVKRLLDAGLTVHAAVRDPSKPEKVKYLEALTANATGMIRFFKSDLLDEGSYADAMAGCSHVFHTASPFFVNVADPQRDLVDPALLGTRNVLEQVNKTPSVEHVVLTSSCAAVYGDNIDLRDTRNGVFTEEDWNKSSSLTHQPYYYSKTVAEREAWQIADGQDRWKMVVVNPHFVMGPGVSPLATSQSFLTLEQMADGRMAMGVPDIRLAVVDVQDVADMHMYAAFHPKAEGRYLTFDQSMTFPEMAAILRDHFGDRFAFPKRVLPKWLVWLVGSFVDKSMTKKAVSRNIGLPWIGDNSKGKRDFGMTYRPTDQAIVAMFQQMIDHGRVKEK
ncbi:MAG: NAD-dependent epimerase/dehydratase family protein [Phycisphaerae bacterium]